MKSYFIKDSEKLSVLLCKQDKEANDCGPLLLKTLSEFISGDTETGQQANKAMLAEYMDSNEYHSKKIYKNEMKKYLGKYNIPFRQIRKAAYSDLITCLEKDNPVLVMFNHYFPDYEKEYRHYALVCGYKGKSLYFLDTYPYNPETKYNEIGFDVFEQEWDYCNRWTLEIIYN